MSLELEIEKANLPPHLRDILVSMARAIEEKQVCQECPCENCTMHAPKRSIK